MEGEPNSFRPSRVIEVAQKIGDQVLSLLSRQDIQDILNSKQFYFDLAELEFRTFRKTEFPKAVLEAAMKAISYYKEKNRRSGRMPYQHFLMISKFEPEVQEVFDRIGMLVAYIDLQAYNKDEWNQYPDKRVIAKSNVRQFDWTTNLIKYKLQDNQIKGLASNVANALRFLSDPESNLSILSESHKLRISERLFGMKYQKSNFTELVNTLFSTLPIEPRSAVNTTALYSKILYDKEIRVLWDPKYSKDEGSASLNYDFQEESGSQIVTDADLLSDNPSSVDELGRKAVMELVFDKVSNLWPELSPKDSYTMLLNGEWGSGKSSMLLYLKEFLEKDIWTVVEYNAWAHQHLDDQWWVLVNKVSKQISDLPNRGDIASHSWWSFKLQNHNTLVVILLAAIFLASGYGLADFFLLEGDDFTLYGSLIGILGTIWVTFTGIVQNIFKRKVNSATLATNHSSDPYKPIKDRFEEVTKDRKVAIFIDDLDRCEIKPTVELLEGIQNLFKQTKVLYVIAADGNWVSNCFNKKYAEFQNLGSEGHSIGNQFLQKSFQMVVDVPKIGADQHEVLWKKYLGIYKEEEDPNQSEKEEFDDKIAKAKTTEDVRAAVQGDTSLEQRKEAAAKVEELIEEDDHLLLDYLQWIPANPRQMKRLINQFIIKYQSLIIANTIDKVSEKALIHYIIFAASYPDYDAQLRSGARTLDYLRSLKDETLSKLLEVELTDDHIRNIL